MPILTRWLWGFFFNHKKIIVQTRYLQVFKGQCPPPSPQMISIWYSDQFLINTHPTLVITLGVQGLFKNIFRIKEPLGFGFWENFKWFFGWKYEVYVLKIIITIASYFLNNFIYSYDNLIQDHGFLKKIKLGQVFMCRVMAKDQGILKIKALHKTLSIHT